MEKATQERMNGLVIAIADLKDSLMDDTCLDNAEKAIVANKLDVAAARVKNGTQKDLEVALSLISVANNAHQNAWGRFVDSLLDATGGEAIGQAQ